MPRLIPLAILALSLTLTTQSLGADIDWSKVDTALGKTAAAQGDVHRYGIPRSLQHSVSAACENQRWDCNQLPHASARSAKPSVKSCSTPSGWPLMIRATTPRASSTPPKTTCSA